MCLAYIEKLSHSQNHPRSLKMQKSLRASVLGLALLLVNARCAAVNDGCNALASSHPDKTFFPGSQRYKFENECEGQLILSQIRLG